MRQINRVAVLGAGVMGASIAAHLANAGLEVLLLDMAPKQLTEEEQGQGLTLASPQVRNRLSAGGLKGLAKLKPAPLYLAEYAAQISVGNFEDDLPRLKECDWVIEVVIEHLPIKLELLRKIAFEDPKLPHKLNLKIPVELETIVLKAMAKNPPAATIQQADVPEDEGPSRGVRRDRRKR